MWNLRRVYYMANKSRLSQKSIFSAQLHSIPFMNFSSAKKSKIDFSINYYAILELQKDASTDDIKNKFRELALIHHPDRKESNCSEDFLKIRLAYSILSDPKKKAEFDARFNIGQEINIEKQKQTSAFDFSATNANQNVMTEEEEEELEKRKSDMENVFKNILKL